MKRITLLNLEKETEDKQGFRLESQTPTDTLHMCLKFNKMYVDITSKYIVLKNDLNEEVYVCNINSAYKSLTNAGIVYYLFCERRDSNGNIKKNKYKLIPLEFKKVS